MRHLNGKIALVTGAAGEFGLGRAIAVRLAKEGADVVVNDVVEKPYNLDESEWRGLQDVVSENAPDGDRHQTASASIPCWLFQRCPFRCDSTVEGCRGRACGTRREPSVKRW